MTREIEINNEAIAYSEQANLQQPAIDLAEEAFKAGAQWADEHPQWISVEDELPKELEQVIMAVGHCVAYVGVCVNGTWYGELANKAEEIFGVTHWMPLPAAPTLQKMQNASVTISKTETTTEQ